MKVISYFLLSFLEKNTDFPYYFNPNIVAFSLFSTKDSELILTVTPIIFFHFIYAFLTSFKTKKKSVIILNIKTKSPENTFKLCRNYVPNTEKYSIIVLQFTISTKIITYYSCRA